MGCLVLRGATSVIGQLWGVGQVALEDNVGPGVRAIRKGSELFIPWHRFS